MLKETKVHLHIIMIIEEIFPILLMQVNGYQILQERCFWIKEE